MHHRDIQKLLMIVLGLLISITAAVGCEQDDATRGSSADEESDANDTDSDFGSDDDNDPNDTGVELPDQAPPVPQCVKECSAPADCVAVGADKLHREANYACEAGLCKYTGCTSDANCAEVYPAQSYVCSDSGECLYPCEERADCSLGSLDADDDNWLCQGGGCVALGCLNSYECVTTYGNEYVCVDVMHAGIRQCHKGCTSPVECVGEIDTDALAFDADNYECLVVAGEIKNFCDYLGCADNAECGAGYSCVEPE